MSGPKPGYIDWSVSRLHVRDGACWFEAWYLPTVRHRGLRKSCIRFADRAEYEAAAKDSAALIARLEREAPIRDEEQRRMDAEPVEEHQRADGGWEPGSAPVEEPDARQGSLL